MGNLTIKVVRQVPTYTNYLLGASINFRFDLLRDCTIGCTVLLSRYGCNFVGYRECGVLDYKSAVGVLNL